MSPRIPALQTGGHVVASGVVRRHSKFLRDEPKESFQRISPAGFKGHGWEALSGSHWC